MNNDNDVHRAISNQDSKVFQKYTFEDKFKLWIPDKFNENSEIIDTRYPYKNRPSIIKVDSTGQIFIAFDFYSKPLSISQVADAAVSIKKMICQVYPYNDKVVLKRFKTTQGLQGVRFSFYTMMNLGRQFIQLFILSMHGQLFIGTETCPEDKKHEWNSDFYRVMKSVEEIE